MSQKLNITEEIGKRAKVCANVISNTNESIRNNALKAITNALINFKNDIITANQIDLKNAKENGLSDAMQDRLKLTEARIKEMAAGVTAIMLLSDPVGKVIWGESRPNGLLISKVTVPLGVIGIIFESRPNVTCDAAALCIKSGNAVILRGGKEAINSNKAITAIMRKALAESGLPEDCIQIIEDTKRQSATELMQLTDYLDVLIPRGGKGLINAVVENSQVPVIETGAGNCHIYIESSADINMAEEIVYNAKCQRPSVCNACETLLCDKKIAAEFLPVIAKKLSLKNVKILGCKNTCEILTDSFTATEEDYYTEYNDYILSVKVVENINEAINHINQYSTGHSEAIITEDYTKAEKFLAEINSAAVYVNASTRFTDGEQFGFGAEIGISTQKLHARGPMGLSALTSVKYLIRGNGQIR